MNLATANAGAAPGEAFTLTATANQNVGYTNSSYRIFIKDASTGWTLKSCSSGTICSVTTVAPSSGMHRYVAVVASARNVLVDIQATSNGFSAPLAGGPTLTGETFGGHNADENCSQFCHKDPINTTTGEFWESTNDLVVPGDSGALAFTR